MLRRYRKPLFALSILIAILVVTCCPFGWCVTLRKEDGEIVYASRVPSGEYVWILYTHSVNKGLVEDGYRVDENGVHLMESRVRQYGAGIPDLEPGLAFAARDGYYELTGYDIHLDTQWTFVGRVADHRLRIGEDGAIVHYNALAEPGTRLGLSAEPWTLSKEIIWRCAHIG